MAFRAVGICGAMATTAQRVFRFPLRVPFPGLRARLRRLPWRRIGLGFLVATVLLAVFPPLRRVVSEAASRAIFWMATPLTPLVADFDELPAPTRLLAADGSELASLSATGGRREPLAL